MSFKAMCLVSIKLHFIGIFLVQLEIPDVRVTQKGEDNHCQMARRHGENADVHSAAFLPPSDPLWAAVRYNGERKTQHRELYANDWRKKRLDN